jgi:signal transduction histidine kinase
VGLVTMKKLYLRTIIGILVILFLSFFLPPIISRMIQGNEMRPPAPIRLEGMSELLIRRLQEIPPEQYAAEIDSLRRFFDCPLQLVDDSDRSRLEQDHILDDSGIISGEYESARGKFLYIPLRQASKVLLMGPVPDRRPARPPSEKTPGQNPLREAGKILIMGPVPGPPGMETRNIIIMVSTVLGIVGLAGFLIVAPVARDLRKLETAASRFGDGDFDVRAAIQARNSVGSVAGQFNRMAESIQRLIQQERQLLQAVSHELRTPISRIRFSLKMLAAATTPEEKKKRLAEVDGEISEIDHLVGELLDYNRFQSQSVVPTKLTFAVHDALDEIVRRYRDFRPEIEIELAPAPADSFSITADRTLFKRAIQNLLANAIRYAAGRVIITFERRTDSVTVAICDDGPGVPENMREHILKPFCRVDQSGSKESGGAGLGLAIVSRIVEMHGGEVRIDKSELGGACFTTTWPG